MIQNETAEWIQQGYGTTGKILGTIIYVCTQPMILGLNSTVFKCHNLFSRVTCWS